MRGYSFSPPSDAGSLINNGGLCIVRKRLHREKVEAIIIKQLILLEGLPGTGKTTIVEWLSNRLHKNGEDVMLLLEGDERIPCDFYETAGIPKKDFELLCLNNPDNAELLRTSTLHTENFLCIRIDKCPEYISKQIRRWDMGDESNQAVSVKDYVACTLERIENWVNNNTADSGVTLIDSGFLQNPVNELLFRKATDTQVRSFIFDISSILRPLNPVCVYLRRNDAGEAISYAKQLKGNEWANRVDDLLKQNDCKDLFERRFALELELLPSIPHLVCKVESADWSVVRSQIESYFAL